MSPAAKSTALFALLAAVYLVIAWPGAGDRGLIAEEATPYLARHPVVVDTADDRGVALLPPHDRPFRTGWIATAQWPNLSYATSERSWPVLIRGYQSSLGTAVGIVAGPPLGGGIAGVRRSSVLLGLSLLALVFALARRLGLSRALAGAATLGCALSPGLLFFSRTGYGFELASREAMYTALVLAAAARVLSLRRALAVGLTVAAAILCRATITATLLPALLLLFVDPVRRSGPRPPLVALALGLGLPVLVAIVLTTQVGLYAGTSPTATLPLTQLADRTWSAPAHLAAQLAWVADPGTILLPLHDHREPAPLVPLAFGAAVFLLALVRWWRERASDGECLFVAATLGNALFGAWLYGSPLQFQLGMALEPLFVLAVTSQVGALARLRAPLLAVLLAVRAWQCHTLLDVEARTANPMLSGASQRALTGALLAERPGPGSVVTTTYNHVGVLETWSSGQLSPVHAYRVLRRSRGDEARERHVAAWRALLRAYPVRFVVFTPGKNLFEGGFTDNAAAESALTAALHDSPLELEGRREFACESGDPCYALWKLRPRGRAQ